MPDWWEKLKGFDPNSPAGDFSESNADPDMDGITHLEEYLEWMANPHYSTIGTQKITIDLKSLARGYRVNPSFSTSAANNGSVSVTNGVAEFTPASTGLASFSFTVSDSEGASMTRKINILSGADVTLPVSLTNFQAERKDPQNVSLKWETGQEINNDHFQIERSFGDASHFEKTGGKIASKVNSGNSSSDLKYQVIDKNSYTGDTYYRLIQKDRDGQTNKSETRLVKGMPKAEFNVWPVPNNGNFFASVSNLTAPCHLDIFDVSGKLIQSLVLKNGSNNAVRLDKTGVYILKVVNKNDSAVLFTQKLVVVQ